MRRTFLCVPPKGTLMVDATLPGYLPTPKLPISSEALLAKGRDIQFKNLPAKKILQLFKIYLGTVLN